MEVRIVVLLSVIYGSMLPFVAGQTNSCVIDLRYPDESQIGTIQTLDKTVVLVVLGFAAFSILLAVSYNAIRKYVFHDSHNLDTTFDAGGRVTMSLTILTVTAQLLWPGDFLQSATVASKYGLAGAMWYSAGCAFTFFIFPIMTIHLKTKAPGAKTFLQVVYARFGKPAHIVFCGMALMTNIVVIAAIIMSGQAAFKVLIRDTTNEQIALILAVIVGSYCCIGGLGTTFYISYFNSALMFITMLYYIWYMYYSGQDQLYTDKQSLYTALDCIQAPDGHYNNSFLTYRSVPGLLNGVIIFFIATAAVYCDQANWQSRIAAKPAQGVVGYFFAGIFWFIMTTCISLTSAMAYMSMSYRNQTHILMHDEIDSGYITPYVMQTVMGSTGGYLLITMMTMALMSTGSGEVMAVSSIIVYDIYKTYINPFRFCPSPSTCLLCGKEKLGMVYKNIKINDGDIKPVMCDCLPANECETCVQDEKLQMSGKRFGITYQCPRHGKYRHYEDMLIRYKTWCILWVTLAHIPFGLVIMSTDINLHWSLYFLEVLLTPFIIPLLLTIMWAKTTSKGIILGSIVGFLTSISINVLVSATMYPKGLDDFIVNSGSEYSVLAGVFSGTLVSSIICVCVSLYTTSVKTDADKDAEWEKTISINNPLNPWKKTYKEELRRFDADTVITQVHMGKVFQKSRRIAYIGCILLELAFVVILPIVLVSFDKFSYENFSGLITLNHIGLLLCAIFTVFVPPIEEFLQIWRQYKANKTAVNESELQQMIGTKM